MIWFIMIFSLSVLGFTALASGMSKHQKQFFGKELDHTKARLAQLFGWILLTVIAVYCSVELGIANGLSYWIGVLTFAGFIVMAVLSYYPKRFKLLCMVSASLFLLSLILNLL